MFDLESFGGGSMFEMMISSLKVPECKRVPYHELLCMLLTVLNIILCSVFVVCALREVYETISEQKNIVNGSLLGS